MRNRIIAFLAVLGGTACTTVLGDFEIEGTPGTEPDGSVTQPGDDASPSTPDAPADAQPEASPLPPDSGCYTATVDEAKGVFVDANGSTAPLCGSPSEPCKTVQLGIDRAKALQRSIVYVGRGTYVESITLADGVRVEGGWEYVAPKWQAICTDRANDAVRITAPAARNITVTAENGVVAGMSTLTVLSKPEAQVAASETIYGVFVRGDVTKLKLENVVVDVVRGGNGAAGAVGGTGTPGAGTCPAATGAVGSVGGVGNGGLQGSIGNSGYVPGDGRTIGATGGAGTAGTAGGAGTCMDNCVTGCQPTGVGGTCNITARARVCGGTGLSGCGGQGGAGGTIGKGGGSSFALFAYGSTVDLMGVSLRAGNGGAGGPGGAGGEGGGGSGGAQGSGNTCRSSCANITCAPTGGTSLSGGAAGGTGGKGGKGGQGGGGSGGWSFAIVQGNATTKINTDATTVLRHGAAGNGGAAGGVNGIAGPIYRP